MGKTIIVLFLLWLGISGSQPLDNGGTSVYLSHDGAIKIGTSVGRNLVLDRDGKVEHPIIQINPTTNNVNKER